ncbi:MAG: nicotinamide-nucleotide amidohydrolase family protein, partial [Bacteroidia bacterium]
EKRAELIIITGGLGPTKDDITKQVLAEYFDSELVMNQQALDNVNARVKTLGLKLLQSNIDQALVIDKSQVIQNPKGSAPGMYIAENGRIYISMPGVPYEMKAMMENEVFGLLSEINDSFNIVHQTLTVVGIPESILADSISDIEDSLPPYLSLAYLPHLSVVRLRITGRSNSLNSETLTAEIDAYFSKIKTHLNDSWYDGDLRLNEVIGSMLIDADKTIGTIESCSGGYLAHKLTSVSGSSKYYHGSLLTYAYKAKVAIADIPQEMLDEYGAVSSQVCDAMAKNAQEKLGVDYCISTTGIAGPTGGTPTKPVGTVYIGLAKPDGTTEVKKCHFRGTREQVIERTSITAFEMIRQALL